MFFNINNNCSGFTFVLHKFLEFINTWQCFVLFIEIGRQQLHWMLKLDGGSPIRASPHEHPFENTLLQKPKPGIL